MFNSQELDRQRFLKKCSVNQKKKIKLYAGTSR